MSIGIMTPEAIVSLWAGRWSLYLGPSRHERWSGWLWGRDNEDEHATYLGAGPLFLFCWFREWDLEALQ